MTLHEEEPLSEEEIIEYMLLASSAIGVNQEVLHILEIPQVVLQEMIDAELLASSREDNYVSLFGALSETIGTDALSSVLASMIVTGILKLDVNSYYDVFGLDRQLN